MKKHKQIQANRIKLLACLVFGILATAVPFLNSSAARPAPHYAGKITTPKSNAIPKNTRLSEVSLQNKATTPTGKVDFKRDVEPIFKAACYQCHGAKISQADFRIDSRAEALKGGVSGPPIIPGNSLQSLLVRRILGEDGVTRMPLKGAPLTPEQINLIKKWIDDGARWPDEAAGLTSKIEKPWTYVKPAHAPPPAVKNTLWVRDSVDNFILAELEKNNLTPSPEASKETLIRRLSIDLTGLPPTPHEIDNFLKDSSANAYEKAVDRLLASPRYGERMAFRWLDAARYADTNGYQIDGDRQMWRWRDWVIEAFNRNLPFDQFAVEQLAGDLLPAATLEQKIATGFNRNHRTNAEGGIVPEEYAVEYVVDRVDTTATVFMGLTVACARCHNHKYDPITQKEYYQFFAYFNSIPEDGRAFDQGNAPPWIAAPNPYEQRRLKGLENEIARNEKRFELMMKRLAITQRGWEKTLSASTHQQWFPANKLLVHLTMDEASAFLINKSDKPQHNPPERNIDNKAEDKKEADKPDVIGFKDGGPKYVSAPTGQATAFDGRLFFDAGRHADFRYKSTSVDYKERFAISAWIYPESEQGGAIVTKMQDKSEERDNNLPRIGGWGLFFNNGKVHFNMVREWNYDGFRAETETTLPLKMWHHVLLVFDGLGQADDRVRIYVNGQPQQLKINQRNFYLYWGLPEVPLRIGGGGGAEMRFKGALDELRIYTRLPELDEIEILACADPLERIATIPAQKRTPGQKLKLLHAFLEWGAPDDARELWKKIAGLKEKKKELEDSFPTVMVMQEMPKARQAFVLRRGAYDGPTLKVGRGTPAVLPPMQMGLPENRLGLAKWLTSPEHPLTARVQVNRFWQMLFGTGLVKTVDDFGSQGEPPTHPALLDWLALEYQQRGWNTKALLKTLVMSATYRQSSKTTPRLLQLDPDNRLLARGPRLRLSAEMIRDQALFVSGLLVERLGGPSVKPYQPDGLYKDMAFSNMDGYNQDKGEGLWRRSLYTYWKRTVLSPNMQVFDASTREFCTVRETRTNTPLQSLNLMNDVTYVEAARMFAQRMLSEGGATPEERINWAFRMATSRPPFERERRVLLKNLATQLDYFTRHPPEAARLLTVGERRNDNKLNQVELAAYTTIASLLLNLDEVLTKQ